jgi:hypothetical protein
MDWLMTKVQWWFHTSREFTDQLNNAAVGNTGSAAHSEITCFKFVK